MTTFLFDKLTDTADFNVVDYAPAYNKFLRNDLDHFSMSPNGQYAAGGVFGDTAWLVQIMPHGSPTKVYEAVFDGVIWTGDPNIQDIEPFCVDDEGDIWGTFGAFLGTPDLEPISYGPIGYIDADAPSAIHLGFSFTEGSQPDGEFEIARIYPFTLPDESILIIVLPSGAGAATNPRFFSHVKGDTGNYTVHNAGGTWFPSFAFQDSNGDVWVCGIPHSTGTITTLSFKRVTSISGDYTSPQTITVPGAVNPGAGVNGPGVLGYFASDCLITAWQVNATRGYDTVIKVNLATQATASADFSADPLIFPFAPGPPDPTFYFVMKNSDVNLLDQGFRVFYWLKEDLTLGTSYNLNSWNAGDIGNDGAATYDDVYTHYWCDGTQCFVGNRYQYMLANGDPDPDFDRVVADLFIYYFGTEPGGMDDEDIRLRVWGFSLDGHDFYALRVGS